MEKFGIKVRALREEKEISREEFCGDETELSVRQLARIEKGQSVPTLNKVGYIAKVLDVTIGELVDGKNLELPTRYKELKYLLLRTPTYGDEKRLQRQTSYFDEIAESYYEVIPEEERMVIDCLQSKIDVHFSDDVNFGEGILNDYFDQVRRKKKFQINDLILIDLYFTCLASAKSFEGIYGLDLYDELMECLLNQENLSPETSLILNNVLLNNIDLVLRFHRESFIKRIIIKSDTIMTSIHDFQRRPVLSLVEWKYYLQFKKDFLAAQKSYSNAILFANLIGDTYLKSKLVEEWNNDTT